MFRANRERFLYFPLRDSDTGRFEAGLEFDRTIDDRVDRVRTYGAGLGYHIGRDLRIGFNVDQCERTSELADRAYDGLRYGAAITYGR